MKDIITINNKKKAKYTSLLASFEIEGSMNTFRSSFNLTYADWPALLEFGKELL